MKGRHVDNIIKVTTSRQQVASRFAKASRTCAANSGSSDLAGNKQKAAERYGRRVAVRLVEGVTIVGKMAVREFTFSSPSLGGP